MGWKLYYPYLCLLSFYTYVYFYFVKIFKGQIGNFFWNKNHLRVRQQFSKVRSYIKVTVAKDLGNVKSDGFFFTVKLL